MPASQPHSLLLSGMCSQTVLPLGEVPSAGRAKRAPATDAQPARCAGIPAGLDQRGLLPWACPSPTDAVSAHTWDISAHSHGHRCSFAQVADFPLALFSRKENRGSWWCLRHSLPGVSPTLSLLSPNSTYYSLPPSLTGSGPACFHSTRQPDLVPKCPRPTCLHGSSDVRGRRRDGDQALSDTGAGVNAEGPFLWPRGVQAT